MANRKRRTIASLPPPQAASAADTRLVCSSIEAPGQSCTLLGHVQQPLAAILHARLLRDPALVDQLLEDPGEALLGYLQDLQQVRHPQARVAVDEVQHPVVRAAEPILGEHGVRLAREVAVGEKQQLDHRDEASLGRRERRPFRSRSGSHAKPASRLGIYVSHVDLFDPDC